MSLRPIDMQLAVPKTHDVGRVQHSENNNPNLQQQHVAQKFEKQIEHDMQQITQTNKSEKKGINPDENSNNARQRNNKKNDKNDKNEKSDKENTNLEKTSMFDVKI